MKLLLFLFLLLPCLAGATTLDIKGTSYIHDCYLNSAATTTNYGSDTLLSVDGGASGSTKALKYSFYRLSDTITYASGLGQFIEADTLYLYDSSGTPGSNSTYSVFFCLKIDSSTVESHNYWGSSSANDWGTVGCKKAGTGENTTDGASSADFDSTTIIVNAAAATGFSAGWIKIPLTVATQYWYDPVSGTGTGATHHSNYGIKIAGKKLTSSWAILVYSTESGNTARQPYLHVVYHTLSTPTLIYPTNNAVTCPITDTLKWHLVAGAVTYRLQVASNNAFTSPVYNDSGLTDTTRIVTGLDTSVMYYWRVRQDTTGGTGPWSAVDSFTTLLAPHHTLTGCIKDNWLDSLNVSTNHGKDTTLTIRYVYTDEVHFYHSAKAMFALFHLHDSLSARPDSAKLHLYVTSVSGGGTYTIDFRRNLKPVRDTLATWALWQDSTGSGGDYAWGTPGAAHAGNQAENITNGGSSYDVRSTAMITSPTVTVGRNVVNLGTYLGDWDDSTYTPSYGWQNRLVSGATQTINIASTEYKWQAYRPWIEYWLPNGATVLKGKRYDKGQQADRYKDRRQ